MGVQATTVGVAGNPDCIGELQGTDEGPCIATTGK